MHIVAQGCVNKLYGVVHDCIVPKIAEMTLSRIGRKVVKGHDSHDKITTIDVHFGEIHEEVTPPDENVFEIFVLYGLPSVGSLYTMAAFLNGPAITDKKKNAMDGPQRGFYLTVMINPRDFDSIQEDCGERFQKVWVEKGYDEKVRVIALDGRNNGDEVNDELDANVFTARDFASWFSQKLANGYMLWLKLNKEAIEMAEATADAAEDKAMADASKGRAEDKAIAGAAKRGVEDKATADVAEGGILMLMFGSDNDED